MAKVYLDTSVMVALANPEDSFHGASLRFIRGLQEQGIASVVVPPILLEVTKATQRRGLKSALKIVQAIDRYRIELATLDLGQLLDLVDRYFAYKVAGTKYRIDLLHYASATLLDCGHLVSWDKKHFNQRVAERINRVNSLSGLITLRIGDPIHTARSLKLG